MLNGGDIIVKLLLIVSARLYSYPILVSRARRNQDAYPRELPYHLARRRRVVKFNDTVALSSRPLSTDADEFPTVVMGICSVSLPC